MVVVVMARDYGRLGRAGGLLLFLLLLAVFLATGTSSAAAAAAAGAAATAAATAASAVVVIVVASYRTSCSRLNKFVVHVNELVECGPDLVWWREPNTT